MSLSLSSAALGELRDAFLERVPDFGDFSAKAGTYWTLERGYKDELRQLALSSLPETLFDAPRDAGKCQAIVAAARQVLTRRLLSANSAQNLLGWRYFDFLPRLGPEEQGVFAGALGELLYGSAPSPIRAERFTRQLWPLYPRGRAGRSYAQARILPTFFLMLVDPLANVAVRTDLFDAAAQRLLGRRVLRDAPFSAAEYQEVLDLAMAVREHLEAWAWCPTDLIDVHSFLWVATRPASTSDDHAPVQAPNGEVA